MRIFRGLLGVLLALVLAHAGADEFVKIPPLSAHVIDNIGMLDAKQRQSLDNVLKEYEARTGSQVAVLLIASTAPEAIEQYSIRVADAWKLGRKGIDDGAILIVARDNPKSLRRLRIEAGRGVQGTLTDAQSKRILQDVIAPHFSQNDFYGGLVAGVSAITALLDQEHLPAAKAGTAAGNDEAADGVDGWFPILFFAFIFLIIMVSRARAMRRGLSSNGWGRSSGIILGSGMGSGGFGGFGGFGGSGDSGGGFSGGGGGFDGGGASGDW